MNTFKTKIAEILKTNSSQIFLYWKGRVGLYALLKSFGIEKGDEVIIPAFTCVVVPNAIIYLGATPKYVDINSQTYNTTLELIKQKVTSKTKCIVIQNTFGLSSEVEEIIAFAKQKNIPTIEDCTHGFGGKYNEKPNGTYADASFFSTQWNKPFSTGIGGFVYLKNTKYLENINQINQDLVNPSLKEKTLLKIQIFLKNTILTPRTYWVLIKLYRFLSKKGIVVGSSSGEEIQGIKKTENYFKGFSKMQGKVGIKNMKKLDENLVLRMKNARLFNSFLQNNSKTYVSESLFKNHSFLKFPILVKDRELFKKNAEKATIKIGDWFVSMIHPIEKDFEKWQLNEDEFPVAKDIAEKMLNLDADTKNPKKVIAFLEKNKDIIL